MKLHPHAQYLQDVVCIKLTFPGGEIEEEWLTRALKHLRSRECAECQHGRTTGQKEANEADFIEACRDRKNPVTIVQTLKDAIERKYNGHGKAYEHEVR